ncbi:MAG: hypothetical protein KAJ29_04765 [Alphaproteobacteria bacterium]|nr:hypothetical protein [Alphaproteobacteria bacterium]
MSNNNETNLDALILAAATKEPQKTAVLISKIFDDSSFDKENSTAQDVANRIRVLVEDGKLEAAGNIRRWRDSTVRLLGKSKAENFQI